MDGSRTIAEFKIANGKEIQKEIKKVNDLINQVNKQLAKISEMQLSVSLSRPESL